MGAKFPLILALHKKYPAMKNLCALFFFFSVSINHLWAQSMLVSDPLNIRNDYGYELIGRLRDRVLLFRDKYDEFEIQAFDGQMHLAWSKELEGLDKGSVQIVAVVPGRNDFSVVHKIRRRGTAYLRINKYDPGANLIDSMTVKDYGERTFSPPSLDFVRSDDRNCLVVINSGERGKLEITCFQLDKMQVLWDKSLKVEEEDFYEDLRPKMALSNGGTFCLATEKNNRRARAETHFCQVLLLDATDERLVRVPLADLLTADVALHFDNQNNCATAVGIYGEKNRDRVNGTFFWRVPVRKNEPQTVRFEPFDEKFLSILRQKDVEADSRGITDCEVRQIVLRQDGGALVVVERHHEIQRGTSAGRGFFRDGMRMIVDYYYDDFFIMAFTPDGTVQWKTVLHKKQYSQDDEGTFSSFFLALNADHLRFLFNDEIKYENTCSEYVVSPLGEFDRNSLLNTLNQNLRLRFRDALQVSASECLVPSEFRSRLKLVLLRF
jgi:hypothetical protein